jgi:hypothetical protein
MLCNIYDFKNLEPIERTIQTSMALEFYGVPYIPANKQEEWNHRLQELLRVITVHLTNVPEREVTVEHLYYDGTI